MLNSNERDFVIANFYLMTPSRRYRDFVPQQYEVLVFVKKMIRECQIR